MKKNFFITISVLILVAAAEIISFQMQSTTEQLTTERPAETQTNEIKLQAGDNNLTFPVTKGSYLLRVGITGMEPTDFTFTIKGKIITPSGTQFIDETYKPTKEILSKKVNGGYIARYLYVREAKGNIRVQLEVLCPEKKMLVCLVQAIE